MNKIISFIFCVAIANIAWVQNDLHLRAGDLFFVTPTEYVYVTNDINMDGDIMVSLDADESASLPVNVNAVGNISYERFVSDPNWHLVSPLVISESINTFAIAVPNDIKTNVVNSAIAVSDNSKDKHTRWDYFTANTISATSNFINRKEDATSRAVAGNLTFTGGMSITDISIAIPAQAVSNFVPSIVANSVSHVWSVIGTPYLSFLLANNTDNFINIPPNLLYLNRRSPIPSGRIRV